MAHITHHEPIGINTTQPDVAVSIHEQLCVQVAFYQIINNIFVDIMVSSIMLTVIALSHSRRVMTGATLKLRLGAPVFPRVPHSASVTKLSAYPPASDQIAPTAFDIAITPINEFFLQKSWGFRNGILRMSPPLAQCLIACRESEQLLGC